VDKSGVVDNRTGSSDRCSIRANYCLCVDTSGTSGGWARRLVVEHGDRIAVQGRYVPFPDGEWLDIAQVDDLVGRTGPWKSSRSLRLEGIDSAAVPERTEPGQRFIPGTVRVVGVWRDDAIVVSEQFPVPWPRSDWGPPFNSAPPPGGWDAATDSQDVDGLDELRATGAIVRDQWIRHTDGAILLRVAAGDVAAVERVLGPQLPRRLYVVESRFPARQLKEVRDMFNAHHADWGFEMWSDEGLTADSQPYAEAWLTRVAPDLADWADSLPDGLLSLHPAMTPA
jgi:hypothetical protein